MKDILDRIADSSANESSHELICRLRDCAHEIEALRSALACRPDAQADERYDLLQAAVNCPHEIESNRVVLHYSDKQPGHNALAQLRERLTRAAAPQAGAAQGAPEGYALMPIDPTIDMLMLVYDPGAEEAPSERYKKLLSLGAGAPYPDREQAPYSAPFTTDVPHCCGEPETCNDPCDASPSRECGERQGAALSDEQARTVECADSWLRMRGLQTYTDLRDTLFAVLRAIGYTEEFAEAHPDLKVSEGVKLFLAASAPTLGDGNIAEEAARIADSFTCGTCGMDGKAGARIRQILGDPMGSVTVQHGLAPQPQAAQPQPMADAARDAKDAKRYRFIKSKMQVGAVQTQLPLYRTLHWIGYEDCRDVRDADAAIDAEIERLDGAKGE